MTAKTVTTLRLVSCPACGAETTVHVREGDTKVWGGCTLCGKLLLVKIDGEHIKAEAV